MLLFEHPEGDNEGPVPERHSVLVVWDFQEPVLLQEASANEFPAEVPALSEYSGVRETTAIGEDCETPFIYSENVEQLFSTAAGEVLDEFLHIDSTLSEAVPVVGLRLELRTF